MRKRTILSLFFAVVMLFSIAAPMLTNSTTAYAAKPGAVVIEGPNHVAKGKTIKLDADVLPKSASQKVIWSSSNEKIAKVSSDGTVKGLRAGTVKIFAFAKKDSSVKGSITITVTAKPVKKITIYGPKELDLNGTKTAKLKADVSPSAAYDKVEWKSSNPKIIKVDNKGKVTALKTGTAKITATAQDGSKVKGELKITVINSYVDPTPTDPDDPTAPPTDPPTEGKRIALLIGNGSGYPDSENKLEGPAYDVRALKGMLQGLNQYWQVTVKENLTAEGMKSAIASTFSGATANDVCLFYYSGHGCTDETSALVGTDYQGLSGEQLAYALKNACPGKVMVILDSCGSGGMVYNKKTKTLVKAKASRSFTQDMINAFSYWNKIDRNEKLQSLETGELLEDKFQVIAACAYGTVSLELYDGHYSFGLMTYSLLKSAGCKYPSGAYSGSMPADTNRDGNLTLGETFSKTKEYVDEEIAQLKKDYPDEDIADQKVQKSGNDNFVFFAR